jgi:hypothetical protein
MYRISNVKIGKKDCSSVDELHTDNIQHNFLCYVIVALTEVTWYQVKFVLMKD